MLKYSISISYLIMNMLIHKIVCLAALSAIMKTQARPVHYDPDPCGDVVRNSNGSSLTWYESIEGVCCNCPQFMRVAELCM